MRVWFQFAGYFWKKYRKQKKYLWQSFYKVAVSQFAASHIFFQNSILSHLIFFRMKKTMWHSIDIIRGCPYMTSPIFWEFYPSFPLVTHLWINITFWQIPLPPKWVTSFKDDPNVICFFFIGTILISNFSVGNPDFVYGLDWKNAIAKTSRICYRIIA